MSTPTATDKVINSDSTSHTTTHSLLTPPCIYCGPAPNTPASQIDSCNSVWYMIDYGWIPTEAAYKGITPPPTPNEVCEDIIQRLQCLRCERMIRDWKSITIDSDTRTDDLSLTAAQVAQQIESCQHDWIEYEEEVNLNFIDWWTCRKCQMTVEDPKGRLLPKYRGN